MLFPVVVFASLALIQQAPAPAAAPAPAPAQTPPPAEAEPTALPAADVTRPVSATTQICRTEPITGSRFGRRVCRSAIQTQEDRAASREMLRQMQGARVPPSG